MPPSTPLPPTITQKLSDYPDHAQAALMTIRDLIYNIAREDELGEVQEDLKWGEPSYAVKSGSPVRIDWKLNTPEHYYIFFNCNTRLVDTFKERYSDTLNFQGNRAIVLELAAELPKDTINDCLTMAMKYKEIKHQL